MPTASKPRTNWHLVVWPIVALWAAAAIYIFASDWRASASVALPIFMAAGAFLVFLLNAIVGSIQQRRHELAILDESVSQCMSCGRSDGPLHVIDYHWYLFLGAIVVQFGQRGKFCPVCARERVDGMFRRTLWGSLFCPPITVWAWLQRRKILNRIEQL
jgi:hypothetical protein